MLERVRRLGLAGGLRGVEQTPETAHVLGAALAAYPESLAVHSLRDGRDVVCSLLERGWLSGGRGGADDAGLAYGAHARFWVEPERQEEFAQASDARRAAWAWRRYVEAARAAAPERTLELRYESLAAGPDEAAERLAAFLGSAPGPLHAALAGFRDTLGRPLAARPEPGAARRRRGRGGPPARRARLRLTPGSRHPLDSPVPGTGRAHGTLS